MKTRQGDTSGGLALFAAELAAARVKAGVSQEELAAKINFSAALVSMVEGLRRAPTMQFAQRCDEAFGAPGTFVRLQQHARTAPIPAWFKPWAEIESVSSQLRLFEHSLIPGLLQTEDYARAILAVEPNVTPDELGERVTARIARQAILYRDEPPMVLAVIDEAVLRRQVGTAKTMNGQLVHLWGMADRRNVTIQVIPLAVGAHCGLVGAFAVAAEADGSPRAVYLEGITEGYIGETPAVLAEVCAAFDSLRSEALPRGAAKDMIMKWAEHYDEPKPH